MAPLRGGFPEPLFAICSKICLPDFERALREGNPPLAQLLRTAQVYLVPEAELEAVDPGARSLWNLNTPEDLARAAGLSAAEPIRAPPAARGRPPHR